MGHSDTRGGLLGSSSPQELPPPASSLRCWVSNSSEVLELVQAGGLFSMFHGCVTR